MVLASDNKEQKAGEQGAIPLKWDPELLSADSKRFQPYRDLDGKIFWNEHKHFPPQLIQSKQAIKRVAALKEFPFCITKIEHLCNQIRILGVTEMAETVSLAITDLRPSFLIDIPSKDANPEAMRRIWNQLQLPPSRFKGRGGFNKEKPKLSEGAKKFYDGLKFKGGVSSGGAGFSSASFTSVMDEDKKEEDGPQLDPITEVNIEEREGAIGFHYGKKEKYWRVRCRDYGTFCGYRQLFTSDPSIPLTDQVGGARGKLKVYHQNWSMVEQFFLDTKVRLEDWIMVNMKNVRIKTTNLNARTNIEMTGSFKDIEPVLIRCRPPKMGMVFDIECISKEAVDECILPEEERSRIDHFPQAKNPEDRIISLAMQIYLPGHPKSFVNTVHALGSSKNHDTDTIYYLFGPCKNMYDEIRGSAQERKKAWDEAERALLRHWLKYVTEIFDIESIEGFNTLGFDLPYVYRRCQVLGIVDEFKKLCRYRDCQFRVKIKTYEMETAQRGDQQVEYVDLTGCTQFDAYIASCRNLKLPEYKLKTIAIEVLKDEALKIDLDYRLLAPYWCADVIKDGGDEKRAQINRYCRRDVQVCFRLIYKKAFRILYEKLAQITSTELNDMMLRGVTQQSWHLIQRKIHLEDWIIDEEERRSRQAAYGIAHCPKCPPPPKDEDPDAKQLGQKIRATNEVAKEAGLGKEPIKGKRKTVPKAKPVDLKQNRISFGLQQRAADALKDSSVKKLTPQTIKYCSHACPIYPPGSNTSYDGGTVLDAMVGFYTNPIFTLDFASLYPSLMQAYLLCFTTHIRCKVGSEEPDVPESELPNLELQKTCDGLQTSYFVQKYKGKKPRSVIPDIEEGLVKERKVVKVLMEQAKEDKDKIMEDTYDTHQKAIKVSANGLYGAMANAYMKAAFKAISMSTTWLGRQNILRAKQISESFKNRVIYGDTDSIFNEVFDENIAYERVPNDEHKTKCNKYLAIKKLAAEVAAAINKVMKPPMKIEPENIFHPFKSMGKKNYVGLVRDAATGGVTKRYEKGVASVRRDYCEWVRDTCTKLWGVIFEDWGGKRCLPIIKEACEQAVKYALPATKLMRTIQVKRNSSYKDDELLQVILFNAMRARGVRLDAGSRVPYLIRDPLNEKENALETRYLAADLDWFERQKYKPNMIYYLDKQFRNPIVKVLRGLVDVDEVNRIINRAIGDLERIRYKNKNVMDHFNTIHKTNSSSSISTIGSKRKVQDGSSSTTTTSNTSMQITDLPKTDGVEPVRLVVIAPA